MIYQTCHKGLLFGILLVITRKKLIQFQKKVNWYGPITQASSRVMNKMKERPELKLVRSHQDDDREKDISKLSDAAQLNIKADALATQGLNKLESNPRVPMDPTAEVLLHQRGRTITRDYKVSIRNNI